MKKWHKRRSPSIQKIVGITGSMGMGKSTLVKLLKKLGPYPVFEADQEIKKIYFCPNVLKQLKELNPKMVQGQTYHRFRLMKFITEHPQNLQKLENILYPELIKRRQLFLQKCRFYQQSIIFLDIPLLFEKQMHYLCDVVIVVHCTEWLQEKRLRARSHPFPAVQALLRQQQLPSDTKKRLADTVILTGLSQHDTLVQLRNFLTRIKDDAKNAS